MTACTEGWCGWLCQGALVRTRLEQPADSPLKLPTRRTVAEFELLFSIGAPRLARRNERQLEHGRVWHALLAARLGSTTGQVALWCAEPERMTLPRSRAIAAATGVPLGDLRAQLPAGVVHEVAS